MCKGKQINHPIPLSHDTTSIGMRCGIRLLPLRRQHWLFFCGVVATALSLPYCLTFSLLVVKSLTGALAGLKNNSVVRKLIMAQGKKKVCIIHTLTLNR